jgi:ACR3 family arsenite transporter
MNRVAADATPLSLSRRMGVFERHLSLWVALCILVGTGLGHAFPGVFATLGSAEMAKVNLPVAVLVWLMIIPMLLKIDFGALGSGEAALARHRRHAVHQLGGQAVLDGAARRGCSSAMCSRLAACGQLDSYIAGLILLAAAPCTAMVFVWSNLCDGDPQFTLSQVALNDLIMVFAFAPIVGLLLGCRLDHSAVGHAVAVGRLLYIVVPVIVAQLWRRRCDRGRWPGCAGPAPAAARARVAHSTASAAWAAWRPARRLGLAGTRVRAHQRDRRQTPATPPTC